MSAFRVIEKFVSIDGEGPTAGALSVFVRFAGCNLCCAWCDTSYAWDGSVPALEMTDAEIADYVRSTGVRHITLTGGEPLLQKGLLSLLARLDGYEVHIETNGSVPVERFRIGDNIHFVVDYKLPGSGMQQRMDTSNLTAVRKADAYKFVVADKTDLDSAFDIIASNQLTERCMVYLSTAFGQLTPAEVVEAMIRRKANGVKLQLQLHKYIWDPTKRGV